MALDVLDVRAQVTSLRVKGQAAGQLRVEAAISAVLDPLDLAALAALMGQQVMLVIQPLQLGLDDIAEQRADGATDRGAPAADDPPDDSERGRALRAAMRSASAEERRAVIQAQGRGM